MNYFFHPYAERELTEAVDFYEEIQDGLGHEFAKEIYSTIQRIIKYPGAWTQLTKNTRRSLTNRFPYGIIYQVHNNEIKIIAVMHLNRKPNYWISRK
ncbi:MAG: type II toxin-antitoxin system RelE/ParE family toxin [bacterium]|nr:type II toxin-antitoxin system RelE/ParE family toxin [bacterium]